MGGPAASREELRGYHDELYHATPKPWDGQLCREPDEGPLVLPHPPFDGADALEKSLRKAREGWEYETVVNQIFACWPK